MKPHFTVQFNHEQRRVKRHQISSLFSGLDFEGPVWSDTWVNPIDLTLTFLPYCLRNEWYTTDSGNYAKLATADFTFAQAWVDSYDQHAKGPWLTLKSSAVNEAIITDVTYGRNRGFYLAWYVYGTGEAFLQMRCGWNATASKTGGVALEFYSDGTCIVYKGGEEVGRGKVSGSSTVSAQSRVVFEVMLLPQRKRELLVYSKLGDGFAHVFEDILETDTDPTITPDEKFWFEVVEGSSMVQCAPLRFPTSGYATTLPGQFGRPPKVGDALISDWVNPVFTGITNCNLYGDKGYGGTTDVSAIAVMQVDGVTAFVPGDIDPSTSLPYRDYVVKISLTGDGSYAPQVYGGFLAYDGEIVDTDGSEIAEPMEYLTSLSFEVPDSAFGTCIRAELREPDYIENDGVVGTEEEPGERIPMLSSVDNQPARLVLQQYEDGDIETPMAAASCMLIDGRTRPVRFVDGLDDVNCRAIVEIRDMMYALERFVFREPVVLDGFDLCKPTVDEFGVATESRSAVSYILMLAGLRFDQMDLSDVDFTIDEIAGKKCGDWVFQVEVGDTAAQVLERLHSRFAGDFVYGAKPYVVNDAIVPRVYFLQPSDLSDVPKLKLYRSVEDAIAGEGLDIELEEDRETASNLLYDHYEEEALPLEANEIWALGYDVRSELPVQSYIVDEESQDPEIAPSLRPETWAGEPVLFGVSDPKLSSQAATDRCVEFLVGPAMTRRRCGQFKANTILLYDANGAGAFPIYLPLWRTDLVELDGKSEDKRISGFNGQMFREPYDDEDADWHHREATYTIGALTNTGGRTMAEIKEYHAMRTTDRSMKGSFGSAIVAGQPRRVNVVTP